MRNHSTERIEAIQQLAVPLKEQSALDDLVRAASSARCVLLGEASHGTSEFYTLRAEITKRLITEHGCRIIAVEGDWPSCFSVNRYIKGLPDAEDHAAEALSAFDRWPEWMWANREIRDLVEWLKEHNAPLPPEQKVGFYGLDVYSLWESMDEILQYLERTGSPNVEEARAAFECFEPFGGEGQSYGLSASLFGEGCQDEVVALLAKLRTERTRPQDPQEEALDAEINALVAVDGERYYRAMITHDAESWNIRDRHMTEVLHRILNFHGPESKAVVWEHNTHIGDARATDMFADGMVNVGQLAREQMSSGDVYAIGFGTHRGTVMAGTSWGAPAQVMEVPQGISGSWEDLLHHAVGEDCVLQLKDAPAVLRETIGHRAIGVVYHPAHERGNYVPSRLPDRYDAFVHVEVSKAVRPLASEPVHV
ncbi:MULTISPECIES: erythromycin esterase family protein [Paenibacillus]|uniref:erythromycin esterase family protein n=1 Tax=Paenibacillus TaxID=44249 RepID=UPI0022B91F19|nr:erythromycin esterase family protein [Paenibacillus caseinilyticus]MCZ8524010.1 erythromycin esterase family protein [Paenibacillus caseinilyticus]